MIDEEFYTQADYNQQQFLKSKGYQTKTSDLPSSFTFNKTILQYSQKDQGSCGSCYQTAAIQSFQERWIYKSGQYNQFSIQYGLGCDHGSYGGVTNNGCNGGNISTGTTTEQCMPYTSYNASYPWKDIACQSICKDGSKPIFYKAKSYRRISGVENIKKEIYENGPVAATMFLYSDFKKQVQNGGIYIYNSSATKNGGHAVVLVGWGEQNGIKYWLGQNTYGSSWNGDGYFKIRMGQNDAQIEKYVVCGDPDVQQQNQTTNNGKFLNTDKILLNNQNISIQYQEMQSCTLYLDNKSQGTIQGSGEKQIQLQTTKSIITATCGNISQQYKVANFTPKFTNTILQTNINQQFKFQFLTNTLIQQSIIIGSQKLNLGTQDQYTYNFTSVGQHIIYLETTNTIPQLQTQIQIQVINDKTQQYAKFTQQPEEIIIGQSTTASVLVKGVEKIKAYLYKENTQVTQFTEIWVQNSSQEKTYQLTVKPNNTGVYYIKLVCDDIIISSNNFNVLENQTQEQLQILQPQSGQYEINTNNIEIITKYCINCTIYLNKQKLGTIQDNKYIILANQLLLGENIINIDDIQISIIILEKPQFDKDSYEIQINKQFNLTILPTNINYSKYYNLYINNTQQQFNNNIINLQFNNSGQIIAKLQSKDNFITQNSIQVPIIITQEQQNQTQQCKIQIPQNIDYLVNVSYQFTSDCEGQHYLVYKNITQIIQNQTKQFTPQKIGNYMICTNYSCSNIIKVQGIKIDLNFSNINTLNQIANINYQIYSNFTDYLYLQYYCKDNNQMQTLQFIEQAKNRQIQLILPDISSCNQAKFRLVNYKYNLYGDSKEIQITKYELPQNQLFNPFENDPIFEIQPQFNISQSDDPQPQPEEEEQPGNPDTPIIFIYPKQNQQVKAGSNITLKWQSNLDKKLQATIILYKQNGKLVKTFTRTAENNGSYEVTIPQQENGQYYFYIRVVDQQGKYYNTVDISIY